MGHWLRAAAVFVAVLAATGGISGATSADYAAGPGFALDGSLTAGFTVYLYRFSVDRAGGGAVVQLHPKQVPVSVSVDAPKFKDGDLLACPVQVGFAGHDRTRDPCVRLDGARPTRFLIPGANGLTHVALLITSSSKTSTVSQATITYQPADNFLGVEFPRCCR